MDALHLPSESDSDDVDAIMYATNAQVCSLIRSPPIYLTLRHRSGLAPPWRARIRERV